MRRRRGMTIGTLIISAIVVAAVIYAAFSQFGSAMQTPYMIGAVDPSPQ